MLYKCVQPSELVISGIVIRSMLFKCVQLSELVISGIVIRSMLSKCVQPSELGKIYSLLASFEAAGRQTWDKNHFEKEFNFCHKAWFSNVSKLYLCKPMQTLDISN